MTPSKKPLKNSIRHQPPNLLCRIIFLLIYLLPGVLYFSYYPIIRLGSNQTMNFELSLPLIWLVLFDLLSFAVLFTRRFRLTTSRKPQKHAKNLLCTNFPGISDRRFFLFSLFPFYATISAFWSPNPLRAILTAGIIWLLFFAIFSLIYILPHLSPPVAFRRRLLESFFLFSFLVCLFCWIQCFLDLAGLSRESSLLCLGCTSQSFGFPHPSGFAIEPQFMGNLLLAPTLTALFLLISPRFHHSRTRTILLGLLTFFFSATLFLTFSRGAIYAYAVALFILFLSLFFWHRRLKPFVALISIPIISFLFILVVQGAFTVIGPTHGSFVSGVTKSIHQLSLGIIDLRPSSPVSPSPDSSSPDSADDTLNNTSEDASKNDPSNNIPNDSSDSTSNDSAIFDGYVAESTNIRLNLTNLALKTWLDAPNHPAFAIGDHCSDQDSASCISFTPTSILFGVGLGGAGTAMHTKFPDQITSPKEIVQNQFASLLLELGLTGIALLLFLVILAFRPYHRLRPSHLFRQPSPQSSLHFAIPPQSILPLLFSLIVAYLVTLNFFAGLPNALHIYLLPPLLFISLHTSPTPSRQVHSRPATGN